MVTLFLRVGPCDQEPTNILNLIKLLLNSKKQRKEICFDPYTGGDKSDGGPRKSPFLVGS